jgi:hypothetical protein
MEKPTHLQRCAGRKDARVFYLQPLSICAGRISRLVGEAKALREIGIGAIAIMPNNTETYREDSFDNMKAFAAKHGWLAVNTTLAHLFRSGQILGLYTKYLGGVGLATSNSAGRLSSTR